MKRNIIKQGLLLIAIAMPIMFTTVKAESSRNAADSDSIVSYEEAREIIRSLNEQSTISKVHFDWKTYKKHPMTEEGINAWISSDSVCRYVHTAREYSYIMKDEREKKENKVKRDTIEKVRGYSRVRLSRTHFFTDDASIVVELLFRLTESKTEFHVTDQCVEQSLIEYWTEDGKRHEEPITMQNPTFCITNYNPLGLTFTASFKYAGHWYYFCCNESNKKTWCKAVN